MEWLRPILVDRVVRIFYRKKKKWVERISERDIRQVLAAIKKEFDRRYYHRRLGYCVTLCYWTQLILLELEKSIRQNSPFKPIFPSMRHETRCKNRLAHSTQGEENRK